MRDSEIENQSPLLTRDQVAQFLGVCKHTVRNFENRGLLGRVSLSKRTIRYRINEVEGLLDQLSHGGRCRHS